MSAGNDNLTPDGPNHAAALCLLNDLMLVLDNAAKQGVERYCSEGEPDMTLLTGLQNVRG